MKFTKNVLKKFPRIFLRYQFKEIKKNEKSFLSYQIHSESEFKNCTINHTLNLWIKCLQRIGKNTKKKIQQKLLNFFYKKIKKN